MSASGSATSDESIAPRLPAAAIRPASAGLLSVNMTLAIGVAMVALVALGGILHSHLGLPAPDAQDLNHALEGPSARHLFGTDNVGRDVLSRTLAAALLDLRVAITLTALSLTIGVVVGALAGFAGGRLDALVMRLADVALAFPFLVLVIALTAVFGPGFTGVYVGVALVGWAVYARLTRAEMLSVRERNYVAAARSLGYPRQRILLRHALPNAWRPALVYSASDVVLNIVILATLSYLGLGAQPPTPEWGAIIQSGQAYINTAWWITALPGVVVIVAGLGFSLIGDAVGEGLGTGSRSSA